MSLAAKVAGSGALIGQQAVLPVATLALVLLLVVPVPALLLDVGFILNIMLSLAVLMVALNVARPLDFSSFPTVLLFATLLRLGLNVASTRVVLVSGHEGPGAAGHVIEAFGTFMIGGDYAVGIFVFIILMIINLIVITKGAGRVSEVSARFVLDAMPGKQMAIDADLNAGLLTPDEAKTRRQEVATESDFYGSMDGASKFVKGDAVAGVLILVVNIVGGLVLGMVSHGLSASEAASTYILLAIGDALVAQVPALLLSIAAASIVTRVASPLDLSGQLIQQFSMGRAWVPVAGILGVLGLIPGMPHLLVLGAAAGAGGLAWKLMKKAQVADAPAIEAPPPAHLIEWSDVSEEAVVALDVGFGLIGLVDERRGAPLMARITGIRRQISRDLGFVVPFVRVRDEMALAPNRYRIVIGGVTAGEGEVFADELLALDTGEVIDPVEGRAVKDPTFGLDALWIDRTKQAEATVCGYTVVDAATVVATHLNRVLRDHAGELFGIDDAQGFIDALKASAPQLVASLTPQPLPLPAVAAICRELLSESVSLRDARRVAGAMIDAARSEPEATMIGEAVRARLGGLIVQSLVPHDLPLAVITLDASLESMLAQAVRSAPGDAWPIEPVLAQRITTSVAEACGDGGAAALVTSPANRRALSRLLRARLPSLRVLAFTEIPEGKAIEVVGVVGDAAAAPILT